jgi:DNA ligase (NAD+)
MRDNLDIPIKEIHDLVKQLNYYRHEYYNNNKSIISDKEYDALYDKLTELEYKYDIVLSNSPTKEVGYVVMSDLNKVSHDIRLLSLDKTKDVAIVSKFLNNKKYVVMSKMDGLTVKLEYNNGELKRASTRGDGSIGEDITHNAKVFKNIPLKIPYKYKLEVVGEAIIHLNDFEYINSKLPTESQYKHPRNLVSGSVRQLDSKVCAERFIKFYAFEMRLPKNEENTIFDSKLENLQTLITYGFSISPCTSSTLTDVVTLNHYITTLKNISEDLKMPIDGIVFTFDSRQYSESLGYTSHHPLASLAFKFKDESVTSTIKAIEWSVGKTQITPVAIFDDIEIDGTTVGRASLHNISILKELKIGIGDEVEVIKANMIIPQIINNLTQSNNMEIIKQCPSCNSDTKITKDNDTEVLICTNDMCSGKILKKLSHFTSKSAMNIDGLSESTLDKFIKYDIINTYSDLFKLNKKDKEIEIIALDGFGKKSYNKLIESIEQAKNTEMHRLIYSMSIPLIGKSASKTIAKYYKNNISIFLEDIFKNNFDFTKLEDFGSAMSNSLKDWFNTTHNYNAFLDVLSYLNIDMEQSPLSQSSLHRLKELTFCVTGTFGDYKREQISQMIEDNGGVPVSSVSKKTNYLIAGEKAGSKLEKANQLNVKVIGLDELFNMINE